MKKASTEPSLYAGILNFDLSVSEDKYRSERIVKSVESWLGDVVDDSQNFNIDNGKTSSSIYTQWPPDS